MKVIGHQNILQYLEKSSQAGKISHAYLFFGPDRIGKKTVALEFIKLINCLGKEKPCSTCRSCRDIDNDTHPDLILIGPVKKEVQIGQIRDLNWRLSLQSHSSPFKAAIIDKAHLMNQEAQNALLKTLEEPRGRAVMVLVTAFPELLLPTIASRAEKIRFLPPPREEIKKYLKEKKVSDGLAEKLISASLGKPGEIIDFLTDSKKLKEREQKIQELEKLIRSPLSDRFQYAKKESQDLKDLTRTLDVWLRYFREKLLSSFGQKNPKIPIKKQKKIINLIQDINFLISKTEVNRRLALEILLLEL